MGSAAESANSEQGRFRRILLHRHNVFTRRKCAGCGRWDAGLIVIAPVHASNVLTFCDTCLGGLHKILNESRYADAPVEAVWP